MSVRLISPNRRYSLQLIGAPVKRATDASGTLIEYQEGQPVIADFRQLGLTEWEQIAALEHFSFSGIADGVNPLSQVSCWDSEAECLQNGWSDEFHATVEARARKLAELFPGNVLAVDKPPYPRPWDSFDVMDVEEIVATLELTGNDPSSVRLYEVENQNRPEVVAAMEKIENERSEDPAIKEMTEIEALRAEIEAIKTIRQTAAPIVEGVVGTVEAQPVNPRAAALEKARAAKAAKKAEAEKEVEGVTVNA